MVFLLCLQRWIQRNVHGWQERDMETCSELELSKLGWQLGKSSFTGGNCHPCHPSRSAPAGLKKSDSDIVHMFFSCSWLTAFWQKIMEKISNSLGTSITINPSLCLLNITKNIKDVRVKHLKWLEVAITTAKRVILRHWKDNEPPTYQEWFNTLAETASYERLIYKINNDLDTFSEIWEPFLTHPRDTSIN